MEHTMREIRTGLLVVISCGVLFVGLWLAGGSSTGLGPRKTYRVRFRNIALLPARTKVAYGGVAVGHIAGVRRLSPPAEDGSVAEAEIEIDPGIVIRTADRAVIASVSLIGEKFLDIEPGPDDAPVLPEGGALVGVFGGFGGIMDDAAALMPVLAGAVAEAKGLASELRGSVEKMNEFIGVTQATIEENRGAIAAALAQASRTLVEMETILQENRETIRSTLEGVDSRVAEAEPLVADAAALAADARERFGQVLDALEDLSSRLETFIDQAEDVVVAADPKVLETLDHLRVASRNMADLTASVRSDPSLLIWGMGEEEESRGASVSSQETEHRSWMGPYGKQP